MLSSPIFYCCKSVYLFKTYFLARTLSPMYPVMGFTNFTSKINDGSNRRKENFDHRISHVYTGIIWYAIEKRDQSVSQSVSQSGSQSVSQSGSQSDSQSVSLSVCQSVSQQASPSASQSVWHSISQPPSPVHTAPVLGLTSHLLTHRDRLFKPLDD